MDVFPPKKTLTWKGIVRLANHVAVWRHREVSTPWGHEISTTEILWFRLFCVFLGNGSKIFWGPCYSLRKHPFLLALRRWGRFAVPSGEEWGETDVFAGYPASLRSRRLEVVGTRKNGPARRRHAPVLSFAHYFQAPATQVNPAKSSRTETGDPKVSEVYWTFCFGKFKKIWEGKGSDNSSR